MKLYYNEPATAWEETLPIGCGILGGMIWGVPSKEMIGLNDTAFWSGYPQFKGNEKSIETLDKVRKEILKGNPLKAHELVEEGMLGAYSESFLPLGNLEIALNETKEVRHYQRELLIDEAVVAIHYEGEDYQHSREIFASYPQKAIFIKLSQKGRKMDGKISFANEWETKFSTEETSLNIAVKAPELVAPPYKEIDPPIVYGDKGEVHRYELVPLCYDGEVRIKEGAIQFQQTSEILFVFRQQTEKLKQQTFEAFKQEHLLDYQALFRRVEVNLGEAQQLPTDERLARLARGEKDPDFLATYFQYNRYLTISASRKGGYPANLQGIWNWLTRPPWSSNYTVNINLEMNYWGCDSCNLSECFEPYSDFIQQVIQSGKTTAKNYYGVNGSVCHHNSDKWALTNPVGKMPGQKADYASSVWAMWTMAGTWLASDLYRHYEYTKDKTYLKEIVYPSLREVAIFILEMLVEEDGLYHLVPSSSPENIYRTKEGDVCSLDKSTTIDQTLIKENFLFFEKTCHILSIEDDLLQRIKEVMPQLPPLKKGKQGQILEWFEEHEEEQKGHRHFSHLYGAYPSELFQEEDYPAVKKSIELRMAEGGGHTGWSNAWLINFYAILKEGNLAYQQMLKGLTTASYKNLWSAHPPFQIDGNYGNMAGFANLFVQERHGKITLLPALPDELPNGSIKGLKLKDNKTVDIQWENGQLVHFSIKDKKGRPIKGDL